MFLFSLPTNLGQQEAQEEIGEDAACAGGDEEGDDVDGVTRGIQSHEKGRDGIGGEGAEDAGTERLGDAGEADSPRIVVNEPAQQRTDHAAGKCHECADSRDVPQEARSERSADAPERSEEYGSEDVDEVLHGRAAAAEHGKAEHAAEDGGSDEDAGEGEFTGSCVKH